MDKESAVIVSLPNGDQVYVGKERTATPKAELAAKLKQSLQNKPASEMVFIAASVLNDFGSIVEVCDLIRKQGFSHLGLLVNKTGSNFPSRLAVDIPAEPSPNDISTLKPNPLTLVVSISSPDLASR